MMGDPYRPDPYLPSGPSGPLLVPPQVARMLWPNVIEHVEDLYRTGPRSKIAAARGAINRWEALVLQPHREPSDPYRLEPFTPTGPDGPLILPHPVAVMLWPAVQAWTVEHERMGARSKLEATGPVRNRWEALVLHAESFPRETIDGVAQHPPRESQHDDWISTADAADDIGCSRQWVNHLARRGDLDSKLSGRDRLINRRSVRDHRQRTDAA